MTAEVLTAQTHRRAATLASYGYSAYAIDGTADTALANITTSSTVLDVLKILDANIERAKAVGNKSIGGATSIQYGGTATDIALDGKLVNGANGSSTAVLVGPLSVNGTSGDPNQVFTLTSGTGDTNNGNFSITGVNLYYTGGAVSTGGTQAFRITATDSAGGTFAEALTITVVAS